MVCVESSPGVLTDSVYATRALSSERSATATLLTKTTAVSKTAAVGSDPPNQGESS
jgi:hypothetical protein